MSINSFYGDTYEDIEEQEEADNDYLEYLNNH
jgi:hypothetical protein